MRSMAYVFLFGCDRETPLACYTSVTLLRKIERL
jgi:hypothetical protein